MDPAPQKPARSKARVRKLRVALGLAVIGGLILTHYFHGDTAVDHSAIDGLWREALRFVALPVIFLAWAGLKNSWRGEKRVLSDGTAANPLSIKIK